MARNGIEFQRLCIAMSRRKRVDEEFKELPVCAIDYVGRIARMIGYRRKVRREVQAELLGHFTDAHRDCASPEERQARAERLVVEFGDPHLMAILCRRAKKRGRPLWLKAIGGVRMAVFLLVAAVGSYTAWFVSGRPVVTDEYLVKLNQLGQTPLTALDNAWPHYEKACALFVEADGELKKMSAFRSHGPLRFQGMAAMNESEREDLVAGVAENEPAWAHYETASRCRTYRKEFRYDRTQPRVPCLIEVTSNPSLVQLRRLSEVGIWKSRLAAEEGRLDDALDNCLAVARTGAHFQSSPCIVNQLVGISLGAMAQLELPRIVADYDLSATVLRDVQIALAGLYVAQCPLANFEGEHLAVLDSVQHSFTKGGLGGGHMIPGQYTGLVTTALELPRGRRTRTFQRVLLWPIDVGASMIHARRDRTTAKINEVHDEIDKRSRLSPYERRARNMGGWEELAASMSKHRYGLVRILLPNESRVSELAFRLRAGHEATLTVLALKRYSMETGVHPPDLQSLVDAGYARSIPADPYSGGPLIYKRVGDEFLLYSVGPDFVDDGGTRGADDDGQTKAWADNGDMVFWP
ncbi:MAG: hypothetical protein GXY19_14675 [Phycisphaerae bacterium]|nr:hypothetical protein [Phycisphaerae bacterium]